MASPGSALRVMSCPHDFFKGLGTHIGVSRSSLAFFMLVSSCIFIQPSSGFLPIFGRYFARGLNIYSPVPTTSLTVFWESFLPECCTCTQQFLKNFSLLIWCHFVWKMYCTFTLQFLSQHPNIKEKICRRAVHKPSNFDIISPIFRRIFAGVLYINPAILWTHLPQRYWRKSQIERWQSSLVTI